MGTALSMQTSKSLTNATVAMVVTAAALWWVHALFARTPLSLIIAAIWTLAIVAVLIRLKRKRQ